MPPNNLHVFDLDGTLLQVNSFPHAITGTFLKLAATFKLRAASQLGAAWVMRRAGILEHMAFKQLVVGIFETNLTEPQKREVIARIVDRHANPSVMEIFRRSPNRVICTSAPFAFAHRMSFATDAILITALDPSRPAEDPENFGHSKVANLRTRLGTDDPDVAKFYTDSLEDQPLIDIAKRAYMVCGTEVVPIDCTSAVQPTAELLANCTAGAGDA